jgi:hypothetical protein
LRRGRLRPRRFNLQSQGIAGDISGNIIEIASELLNDPLFVLSFYKSAGQSSANALKAAPDLNTGFVKDGGTKDFADDAVSSADDIVKGAGETATAVAGKPDDIDKAIDAFWNSDDIASDVITKGAGESLKPQNYMDELAKSGVKGHDTGTVLVSHSAILLMRQENRLLLSDIEPPAHRPAVSPFAFI